MSTYIPSPKSLKFTCAFVLAAIATPAEAQPTLSKTFTPSTIGPGSVTTITFTITNGSAEPVTDLAFTDTLPIVPGPMTIADPANASTDCDLGISGTLTAPDGGSTITLSDAQIGGSQSCTVTVDVTASTPGAHTNPAITLTSSAGSSMSVAVDLTVATDRPGFSKSFAPSAVALGGRSTLTFTIDNTANLSDVTGLDFTDDLPVGTEVADPAHAATDCTGVFLPATLTATPGSSVIALFATGIALDPVLAAGSICTVTVDVAATAGGMLDNVTGELTAEVASTGLSSGKASATLDVTVDDLHLIQNFTDDPTAAGDTVTLEFTILNLDRDFAATNVAFTDDLDAALTGLTAIGLPADPCGPGSVISGAGLLSLTGGNIPPQSSCTFSVTLQVPPGAVSGIYTNTTSAVTGDVDGTMVVGNAASEVLFVAPVPVLTKTFLGDPVGAGDSIVLELTVTNTSATSSATDVAFTDVFDEELPTASMTPGNGCCGAGSICTFSPLDPGGDGTPAALSLAGGTLAPAGMAGDSCTFQITLDVATGAASGTYLNTTSEITATIDGISVAGSPASDDFVVIAAPSLNKEFTDDPALPGATVNLRFTLTHAAAAPVEASDVTFTDDLAATLMGLTATGLPSNDLCGPGNGSLTGSAGDTLLAFSGATLMPGEVCAFNVTLGVPGTATLGSHTNTTSAVMATVLGVTTAENLAASDDLEIASLALTKEFTDDPVIAGGTVTLEFTLDNSSPSLDATSITFVDDLDVTVPNLASISGTQTNVCGAGSQITGTTLLIFTGGSVPASSSCTFSVTLQVPAGVTDDSYVNTTGNLAATIDGNQVVLAPATDELIFVPYFLALTKEFTDDPVTPGGTVNLRFTLTNLHPTQAAGAVAFLDDLDAALAGLVATGLPMAACGGTVSGTDTIDFTGGSLAAAATCSFDVSVSVPAPVAIGTSATNTTSGVTGMIGGLGVIGAPATDELRIDFLSISKSFDDPTVAGGTPQLTFTIVNLSSTAAVTDISFSDDLDAVISGLEATSLPADPCGLGSTLAGTSFLTLSGGNLLPLGSCTFAVELLVPATASPGTFANTTSDLLLAGVPAGAPATDTLTVNPPPVTIDFDNLADGEVVDDDYPQAVFFSPDAEIRAIAAGIAPSPPNIICTVPAAGGATCVSDIQVVFVNPVDDLSFLAVGAKSAGVVAQVAVFSGGQLLAIEDVVSPGGDGTTPIVVDLTAHADVDEIDIFNVDDLAGVGWDDFIFTPDPIPLFFDGFESGDVAAWSDAVGRSATGSGAPHSRPPLPGEGDGWAGKGPWKVSWSARRPDPRARRALLSSSRSRTPTSGRPPDPLDRGLRRISPAGPGSRRWRR